MPIANQIKSLAEDIEASYGARVATVSDIVKETHQTLGGFHRAHQKMADDLRASLSISERGRLEEFATLIRDIKAAVKAIEKDTAETRAENVRELKEMAHKLAEFLSSSEKERLEEFADFMNGVKGAVGAISRDTAQMRADHVKELKEMAKEVEEMLRGFANDQRQARTHWQNLAKVMAAKRAGKPIPKPTAEMGVPAAVKEEAEEAFATGELKAEALKVLQAHPGGMTLPQVGKALNVAYIRVAKPLKELVMEMRATKRDSEYFPA